MPLHPCEAKLPRRRRLERDSCRELQGLFHTVLPRQERQDDGLTDNSPPGMPWVRRFLRGAGVATAVRPPSKKERQPSRSNGLRVHLALSKAPPTHGTSLASCSSTQHANGGLRSRPIDQRAGPWIETWRIRTAGLLEVDMSPGIRRLLNWRALRGCRDEWCRGGATDEHDVRDAQVRGHRRGRQHAGCAGRHGNQGVQRSRDVPIHRRPG